MEKGIIYFNVSPFYVFVQINFSLFALWAMLPYLYFSVEKKKSILTTATENENTTNNTNTINNSLQENATSTAATDGSQSNINFIFHSHEFETQDIPSPTILPAEEQQQLTRNKYSFNIFDGTNSTGAFQDFIFDGDSDDEKEDNEQSKHWANIQDHI
mmetsp:Transcript_24339/g.24606  ORF Transcript_24339/g.24606 Transcript_24339/m.24606 type:complete len:158 (-) Transcript_24339:74-547(-)